MTRLIRNWKELSEVLANDKYKIEVDLEMCSGWIKPIDEENYEGNYWDNHCYLSTHSFYGSTYKDTTKMLQKFGFDVEIDNWDKLGDE